jgi:hypothetical protein
VKLGRVNVEAMLRSFTAKQLMWWEVYARMEPFNELRADHRAAMIAAMVFNMAVDPKSRKSANDRMFQLLYDEEPEPEPEQKVDLLKTIEVLSVIENANPQKPELVNDGSGRKDLAEQLARARAAMGT